MTEWAFLVVGWTLALFSAGALIVCLIAAIQWEEYRRRDWWYVTTIYATVLAVSIWGLHQYG